MVHFTNHIFKNFLWQKVGPSIYFKIRGQIYQWHVRWGFQALIENQKLDWEFEKLGQVFKKLAEVIKILGHVLALEPMVSQSPTVKNST